MCLSYLILLGDLSNFIIFIFFLDKEEDSEDFYYKSDLIGRIINILLFDLL